MWNRKQASEVTFTQIASYLPPNFARESGVVAAVSVAELDDLSAQSPGAIGDGGCTSPDMHLMPEGIRLMASR